MKKIFVHFAEGFEEIEAITPVDVLRRAGCEVSMVSVTGNRMVTSSRNITVQTDFLFDEVDYKKADMLVLPGGMPGSKNLDQHEGLKNKLLEADRQGKWLAAICAAPMVFGHLGLLQGRKATCYPGNEKDLVGATATGKAVEIDQNFITAKGAGSSIKFSLTLVEVLLGKEKALDIKSKMMVE